MTAINAPNINTYSGRAPALPLYQAAFVPDPGTGSLLNTTQPLSDPPTIYASAGEVSTVPSNRTNNDLASTLTYLGLSDDANS